MKFIVSTTTLLKSLQTISGVINSNSVLPILEDFLFEIQSGKLSVFATDLETSMSTELSVEAKENGRIAIPARILLDTLKTLK
jgi:DNA polymerase III subunit beta